MRTLLRRVAGGALLGAAAPLVAALPAPAAAATEEVFVEVDPSTVEAGMQVRVRARCGEEPQPGTVSSRAFPDVRLEPPPGSTIMTAHVTVPPRTLPGDYLVRLRCADGALATDELSVLDMARPTLAPKTGGGGTVGGPHAGAWLLGGALAALAGGVGLVLLRRGPA